jgi:hypothetical protein
MTFPQLLKKYSALNRPLTDDELRTIEMSAYHERWNLLLFGQPKPTKHGRTRRPPARKLSK